MDDLYRQWDEVAIHNPNEDDESDQVEELEDTVHDGRLGIPILDRSGQPLRKDKAEDDLIGRSFEAMSISPSWRRIDVM